MDTHHRLHVWQHARHLVQVVCRLTAALPPSERFVAIPQLRRAEMRRFFDSAIGSLAEVDAMLTTLGDLFALDHALVAEAGDLRHSINGRLFAMLRTRRR
jgi:hypothetical protein